jgi:hypothetical protein
MYNNKQYRTAQFNLEDATKNIGEYLGNVGKNIPQIAKSFALMGEKSVKETPKSVKDLWSGDPEKLKLALKDLYSKGYKFINNPEQMELALKDLAEKGYNVVNFLAPYLGGTIVAHDIVNDMGLIPKGKIPGLHGLKGFGASTLGFLGAEALMSMAEEAKGDLAIYLDYYSDYVKELNAIEKLFPNDTNLYELIRLLKITGEDGKQAIIDAKKKIVQSMKKKNYKIAIRGEANWGSYLHNFLSGAAGGLASGGGLAGAAVGGGGFALVDAGKDIAHNLRSKEYQAAAYSNELVEKTQSMVNQLKKYDSILAEQLRKYAEEFDLYVIKYIYEPKKKRSNSYLDLDYYQSLLDEKVFNKKTHEEPKLLLDYLKQIKSENETE